MDSAFSYAKSALPSIPALVHSDPSAKVSLAVDVSDLRVGAVLVHLDPSAKVSLAVDVSDLRVGAGLRFLGSTHLLLQEDVLGESRYSAFDREVLAAYSAVRHFLFLLEGREFTLFIDHKPLTHSLFRISLPWSAYSNGNYPSSPSSPATLSTSQAPRMLWQMFSPGPLRCLL